MLYPTMEDFSIHLDEWYLIPSMHIQNKKVQVILQSTWCKLLELNSRSYNRRRKVKSTRELRPAVQILSFRRIQT